MSPILISFMVASGVWDGLSGVSLLAGYFRVKNLDIKITRGYPAGHGTNADVIDRMMAAWKAARPDLDPSPLGLVGRVIVLAQHLERSVETRTLENGALHSVSRALYEEVKFDTEKVTTVDWATSPTLRHDDVPERIDVVLVNGDPNPNRPDLPHYGAGETVCKPTLAAIANAVFDATGERLRRIPLRTAAGTTLSGTSRD